MCVVDIPVCDDTCLYVTGCLAFVVDMLVHDWLSSECCGCTCT